MSRKDCDLIELEKFQADAVEFCRKIGVLGKKLLANTEEASVSLQDDISKASLHRIEFVVDKLLNISSYGQQEMETALNKTRDKLEQWNNL